MFGFFMNILRQHPGKLLIASIAGMTVFTGILIVAGASVGAIAGLAVSSLSTGVFGAVKVIEVSNKRKLDEEIGINRRLLEEKAALEQSLQTAQQQAAQNAEKLKMQENQLNSTTQEVNDLCQQRANVHIEIRERTQQDNLPGHLEVNGGHMEFAYPRSRVGERLFPDAKVNPPVMPEVSNEAQDAGQEQRPAKAMRI